MQVLVGTCSELSAPLPVILLLSFGAVKRIFSTGLGQYSVALPPVSGQILTTCHMEDISLGRLFLSKISVLVYEFGVNLLTKSPDFVSIVADTIPLGLVKDLAGRFLVAPPITYFQI